MPVLTKINTNVIADNAVTAAKLPAGAVDADIGVGSVTASHIAADAVGSSEIADNAVLPANIAYLGDGTGKLSGTITGQQLRLGTAFTLTDDLTVNGDLTLSKVRADGTGQSLTQDSSANRTITGTGTLRMGHATEKTSIAGFTGLIDEGVTFPAGHVLQTLPFANTTASTATGVVHTATPSSWHTIVSGAITPSSATSRVLISFALSLGGAVGSSVVHILNGSTEIAGTKSTSALGNRITGIMGRNGWARDQYDQNVMTGMYLDSLSSAIEVTYYIKVSQYNTSAFYINRSESHRNDALGFDAYTTSRLILQEIA